MSKTALRVRHDGDGWVVVDADGVPVSDRLRSQHDAIVYAKELAKAAGGAQVVVFDAEDAIYGEFIYMERVRGSDDYGVSSYVTLWPVRISRVSMAD